MNNFNSQYREGAIGALLDEYQRAISDIIQLVKTMSDKELVTVINPAIKDKNCISVQTILSHVVHSGYGYATSIHNLKGPVIIRPEKAFHATIDKYISDLENIIPYTENILEPFSDEDLEQFDNTLKIKTDWGQIYDIEQMMEHAIVHVLRHRRQLERIKQETSGLY